MFPLALPSALASASSQGSPWPVNLRKTLAPWVPTIAQVCELGPTPTLCSRNFPLSYDHVQLRTGSDLRDGPYAADPRNTHLVNEVP